MKQRKEGDAYLDDVTASVMLGMSTGVQIAARLVAESREHEAIAARLSGIAVEMDVALRRASDGMRREAQSHVRERCTATRCRIMRSVIADAIEAVFERVLSSEDPFDGFSQQEFTDAVWAALHRGSTEAQLHGAVCGALASAIAAHGAITKEWIGSAAKRVLGALESATPMDAVDPVLSARGTDDRPRATNIPYGSEEQQG